MVRAVTSYVARRLVERERALDEDPEFIMRIGEQEARRERRRRRWQAAGALLFGFVLGLFALLLADCCWRAAIDFCYRRSPGRDARSRAHAFTAAMFAVRPR